MNQTTDPAPLVRAAGGTVDRREAIGTIETWLMTPALADLVTASGGEASLLQGGTVAEVLERLSGFSVAWNFRNNAERTQGEQPTLSDELTAAALQAARDLALIGGPVTPSRARYTHVLVPGGKVRACLVRNAGAAALINDGLQAGTVSALGTFRTPLLAEEVALVNAHGLDVDSEFAAMDLGLRHAQGLDQEQAEVEGSDTDNTPTSWRVHRYRRNDGTPLVVLAAPSSEPEVRARANTPDTYAWWADHVAHLGPDDSVLVVTSPIYRPFQHTDAVRMLALPYGCSVETFGTPLATTSGMQPQSFEPFEYLQEIRSAVLSLRNLCSALAAS